MNNMTPETYRDMHLLDAVTQTPDVTQRELSKRIGVALGLTNLMLRRLAKKGYIKISGTKRSRIRYLITPNGILEKSRLTYEYIHYSLQLYGRVRGSLREQLAVLGRRGQRRIMLWGAGELAEIAFLTIQEMGLQFAGMAAETVAEGEHFLGHPVRRLSQIEAASYDRIIVTALQWEDSLIAQLVASGVPAERILLLTPTGLQGVTAPEPEVAPAPEAVAAP